jgi:hypothetical protein
MPTPPRPVGVAMAAMVSVLRDVIAAARADER